MSAIPEITPRELEKELASGSPPVVVDVREADELEISRLKGAIHIPMSQFVERLGELDKAVDLVLICRSGSRSGRVAQYLIQAGFTKVRNLVGGMNRWVAEIDPSQPQY